MNDPKIIRLEQHRPDRTEAVHLTTTSETAAYPADGPQISDPVPAGFVRNSDGVYLRPEANSEELVWLCSPLQVTAISSDAAGKGWGRLVEVTDPAGKVHQIPMAESELGSPTKVRSILSHYGLRITTRKGATIEVVRYLQESKPQRRYLTTNRLGWVDGSCKTFVLGDLRVLGEGDVVPSAELSTSAASAMRPVGTLDEWRERVAGPCVGNPLLILGVSLAFSGPLLELLELEGGGLHLRGGSSSGKSTIQRVATSVWGAPGFLHSWRATANGLENIASSCNATLLALDELAEINAADAGNAAYMLANGAGKARATSRGLPVPTRSWSVAILSSGEISLTEKLAEGGRKAMAGQNVRLLDISADTRSYGAFDDLHGLPAAAFADGLKIAASEVYGTAGPEFVSRLLKSRDVKATLRSVISQLRASFGTEFAVSGGVNERALTRFALIATAGELATRYGLTGWPKKAALKAAKDALADWIETASAHDFAPKDVEASIIRTRAFLTANLEGFVEPKSVRVNDGEAVTPIGWSDGDSYLFTATTWHALHRDFDPQRAAKHLRSRDLLISGDGNNLARKGPAAIPGRPRVYAVRNRILEPDKS